MSNSHDTSLNELDAIAEDDQDVDTDSSQGDEGRDTDSDDTYAISESDLDTDDTQAGETAQSRKRLEAERQQVNVWAKRIENGTATLEDLESKPQQKWMVPKIKEKLGIQDYETTYEDRDIDTLLEEKLRKREDEKNYKDLIKQLPPLSKSQVANLKDLMGQYLSEGIKSKYLALKTATQLMRIDPQSLEKAERHEAARSMQLRPGGQPAKRNPKDVKSITSDDTAWKKYLEGISGIQK